MIKVWLQHKILEYCIEIIFREFYRNFVFPQIMPRMSLTLENGIVTIQDDKNTMTRKFKYQPSDEHLYIEEITELVIDFLKKYHYKVHNSIINSKLGESLDIESFYGEITND